jgi:hypothetical protein
MKQEVATVGLDLAKNVFQVHAIGSDGAVLVRRKLRRAEVIGFFRIFQVAWSAWKRAHRPIIGPAS